LLTRHPLTWEIYYLPALSFFEEAVFFGDGEGIIALRTINPENPELPTLFKTNNGGETWAEIPEGTGFTQYNLIYESPYGSVFLTGVRGGETIMLNYDMATGQITESISDNRPHRMAFYSETSGFAWSIIGEAFQTNDAGVTWTAYENNDLFGVLSNMLIANADNWLLTEEIYTAPDANNQVELQEHKISETLDGGLTWETRRLLRDCRLLTDYYPIPGGGYVAQASITTNIIRYDP
jgi:hypothetical protein